MKISLFDYDSVKHEVEVPDDTQEISGIILSGDMVMLKPYHYDTGKNRSMDFFDGTFCIKREMFETLNMCDDVDQALDLEDEIF